MADFPSPASAYGRWGLNDIRDAIMGGNWPTYEAPDPYFEYVTMLLPGNGTNGAQNNTFTDSSTSSIPITRNGNTTQGTFSPYGSNWSNYFDGNGDYIALPNQSISLGSGSCSVEFWCYITGEPTANPFLFDNYGNSSARLFAYYDGNTMYLGADGTTRTTTFNYNSWNFFQLVRSGGTAGWYLNGTLISSTFSSSGTIDLQRMTIGAAEESGTINPSQWTQGYISNFRASNTNRSTTVPTTPFTSDGNTVVLTCQSNRFIDNSSNNFSATIGGSVSVQRFSPFSPTASYSAASIGGSGYFDGTGDYLSMDPTALPSLGSGGTPYTIDIWVYYPGSMPAVGPIFARGGGSASWSSSNGNSWGLFAYDNNWYYQFNIGGNFTEIVGNTRFTPNNWHHLAVSYNGTTTALFVDGIRIGTVTNSYSAPSSQNNFYIGRGADNGYNTTAAFFSDARIVSGTAIYDPTSSTLTVPTAPLTAVTNTKFLASFTNAGIIDNAMMNDLETVGNAQISTTQSKFGGSSMYFDGTSDGLFVSANPAYAFGTGDFTVECWINTSTTTSDTFYRRIWMTDGPTGNASGNFQIALAPTTGYVNLWDGTLDLLGTSNVCDGVWHHIAATRSGTTLRLFVDGTQQASTTYSVSVSPNSGRPRPYIGTYDGSQGDFNGYIDDLRITKGYARYTANFTPPTAAFPNN